MESSCTFSTVPPGFSVSLGFVCFVYRCYLGQFWWVTEPLDVEMRLNGLKTSVSPSHTVTMFLVGSVSVYKNLFKSEKSVILSLVIFQIHILFSLYINRYYQISIQGQ